MANDLIVDNTSLFAPLHAQVARFPKLAQQRSDAWEKFAAAGLPANKSEEYKHTPVARLLEKNFSERNTTTATQNIQDQSYILPELDSYKVVFVNGQLSAADSTLVANDKLVLCSLEEALEKYTSDVTDALGTIAHAAHDPFVALNTAAWSSGLFVKVAPEAVVDKPICIYHLYTGTEAAMLLPTRLLIHVANAAACTIIEKNDTLGDGKHFANRVAEAFVGENALLNHYSIQHDKGEQYLFNQFNIDQKDNSKVNAYVFTLEGKLIRNNLQLSLDGEGCESHMYGLYLLDGDILADNHTVADHRKPNSFSNELYKGVMADHSKGVFNGKIYVRPDAQKTNAFQSNRNILLSENASVNTKPQLEIWADDVKCSHGCTSGQLDEEALFYLQTRGLSKETARAMLLYAFAGEVIDAVTIPALRKYLDELVAERLHKDF